MKRYAAYQDSGVTWLGNVPKHWSMHKFRYVFFESSEKIENEAVGTMLSVSGYRGIEIKQYDDENRRRLEDDLVGYRVVRQGQLVVNTMWLNYAGLGVSDFEGHVSPAYRSYWISDMASKKFVHYFMRSAECVKGYTKFLTGIRPNSLQMSRDDLMAFPILIPPLSEQSCIVNYLDQETAKIDELIAEKERLIELLKEKRQALISHAVTKGLDPDVLMKDSGIEWLEAVPEHWTTLPLKRFTSRINRGVSASYVEEEEGIPILGQSCIYWDALRGNNAKMNMSVDFSESKGRLKQNDILINSTGTGTLGRAQIFNLKGNYLADSHVTIIRLHNSESARYFFYVLQSNAFQGYLFSSLVTGATNQIELSCEKLRNTGMPFPPLQEQITTANYLDQEMGKIDLLVTEANKAITLLQEKRSALISAVVTGKVDVRHLVEAS